MEALIEKGGFHDHDCDGRTIRWGWTRSVVQCPRPQSGDSRCGINCWLGDYSRRGGSIVIPGRHVCYRDLPSDWLSRGKRRALRPRAARGPGPRNSIVDFDFAAAVDMVTGRPMSVRAPSG